MCDGSPSSVSEALAQLRGALDYLNASDAASLPGEVQAQALRELECAEARHTAARARYLAAFTAQSQYEADGQGTTRAWLKWQTHVTSGAAAGAVGWSRRLAAHPVIDHALAAGELSSSWAKNLCAWTDRLPRLPARMPIRSCARRRLTVECRYGISVGWGRSFSSALANHFPAVTPRIDSRNGSCSW